MKKFYLFSIVLLSLAFAFNISDFLYSNENLSSIKEQKIQLGSLSYSLYYSNNIPILLVDQAGNIINDSNSIKQILESFYSKDVLLAEEDKNAFLEKIKAFNKSRDLPLSQVSPINSQYGTEKWCKQSVGIESNPCNSQQSCFLTANVVCALFATSGGAGDCDPYLLGPAVYDYSTSLLALDEAIGSLLSSPNNLSIKNAAETYSSILKNIEQAKSAAKAIQNSNLMANKENPNSIGVCFSPKFDFEALSSAKAIIEKYNSNLGPLKEFEATVNILLSNSAERIAYFKAKQKILSLKPRWEELKTKYLDLYQKSQNYSQYLADSSFVDVYKRFSSSWSTIENKISTMDEKFLEQELDQISTLAPKLQKELNSSLEQYLAHLKEKQNAANALNYLKYSLSSSKEDQIKYLNFSQQKQALDTLYFPPQSAAKYKEGAEKYKALALKIKEASKESEPTLLDVATEKFGQGSTAAFFALADSLAIFDPSAKKSFAPFIPPITLLLIDLAIISTFSIVFFGIVIKYKHLFKKKNIATLWLVSFLVFLFFVIVSSVAFYFSLDSAQKSARLSDFIHTVLAHQKLYVVLDSSNLADSYAPAKACAAKVAGVFKNNFKKDVFLVELGKDSCLVDGKNTDKLECSAFLIGNPIFELKPAASESLTFNIIYEKKALYQNNKNGFESCAIADALNSYN
ncbi:MAG: hypothetical protein N3D10_02475 [Candidatus Micrarchaeota archaeon]|nr:hypothetical protein [Candidatus Micrarchaeota archaeon]